MAYITNEPPYEGWQLEMAWLGAPGKAGYLDGREVVGIRRDRF